VEAEAVAPIADALEQSIRAPYRAQAVRRDEATWAAAARAIEVVELPDEVDGGELVLSSDGAETTLTVDGQGAFGSVPELERLGSSRFDAYVVHAERLDGNLWDVRVSAL
jgi:hypothetical protein